MRTYVATATEMAVAVITMKTNRGLMMKRAESTAMTRVLLNVCECANPTPRIIEGGVLDNF